MRAGPAAEKATVMTNRSDEARREIEFSAAPVGAETIGSRGAGLRTDFEAELGKYFSGFYTGAAGLHSTLGQSLDRVRDEVGFGTGGTPDIGPPHGIDFSSRLEIVQVEFALSRLCWKDRDYLRAHYTPLPTGAMWGLLGLPDVEKHSYAWTAILTTVVQQKTGLDAPTFEQRASALRALCKDMKDLATPLLRAGAKATCKEAVEEAARTVKEARRNYGNVRKSMRSAMRKETKAARIEAFRKELGLP